MIREVLLLLVALAFLITCDVPPTGPSDPDCCEPEKPEITLVRATIDSVFVRISDGDWHHSVLYRDGKALLFVDGGDSSYIYENWIDVEPNTTYEYIVVISDTCGMASDTLVVTTPRDPKPLPFTWVRYDSLARDTYRFSWLHPEDDSVYYAVMRNDVQVKWTEGNSWIDEDLPPGTYVYRIIAISDKDMRLQTASEDIIITIYPLVDVWPKKYYFKWDANTEPDLAGYRAHLLLDAQTPSESDTVVYVGIDTIFVIELSGHTCGYVVAYDTAANYSEPSNIACTEDAHATNLDNLYDPDNMRRRLPVLSGVRQNPSRRYMGSASVSMVADLWRDDSYDPVKICPIPYYISSNWGERGSNWLRCYRLHRIPCLVSI